jgi:hypothetical protein
MTPQPRDANPLRFERAPIEPRYVPAQSRDCIEIADLIAGGPWI